MLRRNKVFAYIIRGEHLLVFRHVDFPEAGIQIPGGTMEGGEDPALAVLREPSVPDSWLHDELYPSDGSPAPITFEFYWLPAAGAAPIFRCQCGSAF